MPRPAVLPGHQTLQRWVEEGLTHQQIADRIYSETGERITRGAVSVALSRAGLTVPKHRYSETIPWPLQGQALHHYAIRMLRLLGRRREGGELTDHEAARLDSWLARLKAEDAVVAYDPDHPDVILYVKRRKGDGRAIPIRKARVHAVPE